MEADLLHRQVATLAAELAERDRMLHTIQSMQLGGGGGAGGGGGDGDEGVAMQVRPLGFGAAQFVIFQ